MFLITLTDDLVRTSDDIHKAGYYVHNLTMQWLLGDMSALTVIFGGQNPFDKAYYFHASHGSDTVQGYETGRNVKLP